MARCREGEREDMAWCRVKLLLATVILLTACASPEPRAAMLCQHEVPFFDGQTLSLDGAHHPYWTTWRQGTKDPMIRKARGLRLPKPGDRVLLRMIEDELEGVVLDVTPERNEARVQLDFDAWHGMSGAGAWYEDDTIAGVVDQMLRDDHRIIWIKWP